MDTIPDEKGGHSRQAPVKRIYLESLTTTDLIRMADSMGLDIPPDLERKFIIEELLEILTFDDSGSQDALNSPEYNSGASSETFAANSMVEPESLRDSERVDSVSIESAHLPKQYNITFIEVIIRDPLWAFVFWEIKTSEKEQHEKMTDFSGYYLKVSPWSAHSVSSAMFPAINATSSGQFFLVSVKPEDSSWYLGLTDEIFRENQKQFVVELCAGIKGEETVLAVSNPFTLPVLPAGRDSRNKKKTESGGASINPLVRLSGLGDFHILRNNERMMRTKKSVVPGSYE